MGQNIFSCSWLCDGISTVHSEGNIEKLLVGVRCREKFSVLPGTEGGCTNVTLPQSALGRTSNTGSSKQNQSPQSCWNLLFFFLDISSCPMRIRRFSVRRMFPLCLSPSVREEVTVLGRIQILVFLAGLKC